MIKIPTENGGIASVTHKQIAKRVKTSHFFELGEIMDLKEAVP
ncbi:hypothetical protein NUS51_00330 [Glaesserella parasuis]|nr:hypothetical protein [Glaesserella parasuis]